MMMMIYQQHKSSQTANLPLNHQKTSILMNYLFALVAIMINTKPQHNTKQIQDTRDIQLLIARIGWFSIGVIVVRLLISYFV